MNDSGLVLLLYADGGDAFAALLIQSVFFVAGTLTMHPTPPQHDDPALLIYALTS